MFLSVVGMIITTGFFGGNVMKSSTTHLDFPYKIDKGWNIVLCERLFEQPITEKYDEMEVWIVDVDLLTERGFERRDVDKVVVWWFMCATGLSVT